jgi:hypothetical protein
MSHAGEDDVWAESPDEPEQLGGAVADSGSPELVDGYVGRKARVVLAGGSDQGEMDVVFAGAEMAGQDFDDVLGSPAAEVWNEEKNPGRFWRRHVGQNKGYLIR